MSETRDVGAHGSPLSGHRATDWMVLAALFRAKGFP
jgi:hypothetical protein